MSIRSSLHGAVAVVELVRPPHNLLDAATVAALADELERRAADADVRAIVLAAEGRSFCAGGTFAQAPSADGDAGTAFRAGASAIYGEAARVFAVTKPLVAAVHGAAIGAGLGLALACDVRVTCPSAWFQGNFVRLGIHPGLAVSETLPATVGPARAADMLLTGRRVDGEEAMRIGLADRLVADDAVRDAALAFANEIAAQAPLAVASTRAALRAGLAERARAAMAREIEEQARLIGTADAAEGIAAMLQKRAPTFEGR